MNTKRRYPGDTGFYGENRGRKKDEFKTIHVPRVRGIDGANGAYVHRIGLAYAQLDGNAKSREFLLAMEPLTGRANSVIVITSAPGGCRIRSRPARIQRPCNISRR
jgi:hypothetical protein